MGWITDPTIWVGFLTLIVLEIVLGIDNLIFIAILADKLPPGQRDRARVIGLSLALVMRLGLLASISWVMSLTTPLFTLLELEISWRDLILIGGGAFLLIKATIEIHERLEGQPQGSAADEQSTGAFWLVVAQIVALDVVFSLDSVITAIGMVDEVYVMMAAVVVAVLAMLVASKPLAKFINAHPSVVILGLGFLLMVGLVLIADGLGVHVPKGYLYAAIGFSVLIESFNQVALHNRRKRAASLPQRQRVADAVVRLLGGVPMMTPALASGDASAVAVADPPPKEVFAPEETHMVRRVLALASRPVQTIMTPRPELTWIDANDSKEATLAGARQSPHRQLIVSRGSIDEVVGIVAKDDLYELSLADRPFDVSSVLRPPVAIPEGTSILDALKLFKGRPVELALVVDEYGGLRGIVTQTNFLESIAGDLPEAENEAPEVKERDDGSFAIDGAMSIFDAQERLGLDDLPQADFHTVAGFLLFEFGRIPAVGERIEWRGWSFEVSEMVGLRVKTVLARRVAAAHAPAARADA